ncbi:MAG TPA: DedA family protein [Lichenihabitans sp.]|jgi:membrane protein DedA with SNARE-associated domain|nr:DedA family protein [Lichenihabitans sp.]
MGLSDLGTWAIDLVRAHQAWAAPICFVLAFAESLAFVSLIVPSSVMLIGIGGLVGYGDLSFIEVFLASAIGAGCGDWLSYWLGGMFKDRIGEIWPFSRHPGWLPRARSFVERWGWSGVFLGRFLGPLRATVPIAAGLCVMPRWRFQLANWSSAFVWAFALLAPGAFGLAWLRDFWD